MKKQSLKYIGLGLAYFMCVIFSNIAVIFKPLYKKFKYGKYNQMFFYLIASIILIVCFLLIRLLVVKKLRVDYDKDKSELDVKRLGIVYGLVVLTILIISAIIGWEIRFLNDLGSNFGGNELMDQLVKTLYALIALFVVTNIIENFEYGFEGLIKFKNINMQKFFPTGGIVTMILYGSYELIIGFNHLPILYFFIIGLYGFIYLLCNRSISKTYIANLFIYLF